MISININNLNETFVLLLKLFFILQEEHCLMCDMMDDDKNYNILLDPQSNEKYNYTKLIIGIHTWNEIYKQYKKCKLIHNKGNVNIKENIKENKKLNEMKECMNEWKDVWEKIYIYYNNTNDKQKLL
jgi:hypothetical protein